MCLAGIIKINCTVTAVNAAGFLSALKKLNSNYKPRII